LVQDLHSGRRESATRFEKLFHTFLDFPAARGAVRITCVTSVASATSDPRPRDTLRNNGNSAPAWNSLKYSSSSQQQGWSSYGLPPPKRATRLRRPTTVPARPETSTLINSAGSRGLCSKACQGPRRTAVRFRVGMTTAIGNSSTCKVVNVNSQMERSLTDNDLCRRRLPRTKCGSISGRSAAKVATTARYMPYRKCVMNNNQNAFTTTGLLARPFCFDKALRTQFFGLERGSQRNSLGWSSI